MNPGSFLIKQRLHLALAGFLLVLLSSTLVLLNWRLLTATGKSPVTHNTGSSVTTAELKGSEAFYK